MGSRAKSPCSCFSWCDKDSVKEISEYLDVKSTMMLAATCKWFNPVMSQDCIWKYVCLHNLQIPDPGHAAFKWSNAFDDALLLEDLASPSRSPNEETVEDTLMAGLQLVRCPVCDLYPCDGPLKAFDEFLSEDLLGYQYGDKTWRVIEDAINQIHDKSASEPGFEVIYRKMGFDFNSTNAAIAVLQMAALITATGPQCEKSGSIPELPTDVLSTVLAKLPVKAILRFRIVCKKWETIMRKRWFLKQQFERSRDELLLVKWHLHENDLSENILSFYDPANGFAEWAPQMPFLWDRDEIDMGGSCRGLVCLLGRRRALICNPSRRQIRVLDHPYIVERRRMFCSDDLQTRLVAHAFGYDSATDAYKIYRLHNVVMETTGAPVYTLLEFYNTASNSWDTTQLDVGEFDGMSPSRNPGVFFMGSCHFKAFNPPNVPGSVMCINCSTNGIRRFPLPPGLTLEQNHTLTKITDRLALVTYPIEPPGPMEVWVFDGYGGVGEMWSLLLNLNVNEDNWFDRALFFIKDELILVERDDDLQPAVVDLQTNELRDSVQLMVGAEFCWDATLFRESAIDLYDVIPPPPNQV